MSTKKLAVDERLSENFGYTVLEARTARGGAVRYVGIRNLGWPFWSFRSETEAEAIEFAAACYEGQLNADGFYVMQDGEWSRPTFNVRKASSLSRDMKQQLFDEETWRMERGDNRVIGWSRDETAEFPEAA